ncbi:hypothetical protein T440DRAFT_269505 [Plenodomus tracheiphilus IPT5]|uniref:F-box domain-containing protein n=1 Tax=Plenodomus tracheiphilus IPT5 TaxID=1408161 RepID=A0A6A7BHH5_9PLEO|nr:hypothetical protein T440DRAFT_269505 [Plenodomus tracheiphilus IPT5]
MSFPSSDSNAGVDTPLLADQPFRLLNLPTELRLLILKEIEVETRLYKIKNPAIAVENQDGPDSFMTLAITSLPTSILGTCRMLKQEASRILAAKTMQLCQQETDHFIFDYTTWMHFTSPTISNVLACIEKNLRKDLKKHGYPTMPKFSRSNDRTCPKIQFGSQSTDKTPVEYYALFRFLSKYLE